MFRRYIATATIAAVLLPAAAFAETDVQSQVQSLLSQIRSLQQQLVTLIGSSSVNGIFNASTTPPLPPGQAGKFACMLLNRNLGPGSQGEDVRKLQEILGQDPMNEFHGNTTGFFGPLTARAMMKFQIRNGIASSTDGRVGPMTRGFFERACGKGLGMQDNRGPQNAAMVRGQITSVSESSITVKIDDSHSRVVNITSSTTIQIKTSATSSVTTGSKSDLTVGKKVSAEGAPQSDGSLTARIIRVGDFGGMMEVRGGNRGPGGGSATGRNGMHDSDDDNDEDEGDDN